MVCVCCERGGERGWGPEGGLVGAERVTWRVQRSWVRYKRRAPSGPASHGPHRAGRSSSDTTRPRGPFRFCCPLLADEMRASQTAHTAMLTLRWRPFGRSWGQFLTPDEQMDIQPDPDPRSPTPPPTPRPFPGPPTPRPTTPRPTIPSLPANSGVESGKCGVWQTNTLWPLTLPRAAGPGAGSTATQRGAGLLAPPLLPRPRHVVETH